MLFLNTKNVHFLNTIKCITFKYEKFSILNTKNVLCSNTKNALFLNTKKELLSNTEYVLFSNTENESRSYKYMNVKNRFMI